MIKLINKSKLITNEEIENCLSLLKKKYKNVDVEIKLYNNMFQFLLDYLIPFNNHQDISLFWLNRVARNKVGAWYCNKNNNIKVFTFNRRKKRDYDESRLQVIFDILHELRHAYQNKNMNKRYQKDSENYLYEGLGYAKQWVEIDANNFAREVMDRKKEDINKILRIKGEWHFND